MIVLHRHSATGEQRWLVERACTEATRRDEPVLLAYTRGTELIEALRLYGRAVRTSHDAVYWEQPSLENVMVAAGVAHVVEPRGARRFSDAAAAWRALVEGAVSNRRDDIVALAGFSFAAQSQRAAQWAPFGDGALVVPELLYRRNGTRAEVTFATIVRPGTPADDVIFGLAPLLDETGGGPPAPCLSAGQSCDDAGAADEWAGAVAAITAAIAARRIEKAVLAREVVVRAREQIDETAVLARLRDGYPGCTVFSFRRGPACFVGATPEQLVRVEGRSVHATCVAGSARRGADAADDEAAGRALLADGKERREHQLVVDMIAASLAPLCDRLDVPAEPVLMRMPNVQHLYTPVQGTLTGDVGVLELVERLHPTPAVGGMPREEALALIHRHETFDRGWYAGPVGWVGASGDGEFAVALRSGLVTGREARLFAGCGIVAGSDPQREYEESILKLRPMLWALNQI